MAHLEQQEFFKSVKSSIPDMFFRKKVLDVGSLDINGSNKGLFTDCDYTGIDIAPGKNVDIVIKTHEHKGEYDTIISGECFEHDMYFDKSIKNICKMLKNGGLLVFSCAGKNRAEHGTRKTDTFSSPLTAQIEKWEDFYQNRGPEDFKSIPEFSCLAGGFIHNRSEKDLYYCGIKK